MMETSQETPTQTEDSLSERLKAAYRRVSPAFRVLARRDFCSHFGVTDDTFRSKRSGAEGYAVTEQEIEWMEAYKPVI